jgi:hypothetical protein
VNDILTGEDLLKFLTAEESHPPGLLPQSRPDFLPLLVHRHCRHEAACGRPDAVVLSQGKGWAVAIAVCPGSLAGWFVSPVYPTFRCTPGESDPKYFAAILNTPWFWQHLAGLFLTLDIPFPPIQEQLQAVRMFDGFNRAKKLQLEASAELDALLKAVLTKAFAGEL